MTGFLVVLLLLRRITNQHKVFIHISSYFTSGDECFCTSERCKSIKGLSLRRRVVS